MLSTVPASLCYHNSPPAVAAPSASLDTLFQYTTARNHRVISQAVDFVMSMHIAPTCTRMAASHLMNECKMLENAPDFAKSRPEAYLDSVKTEYAAKLAVCELLSTQPPSSAVPPTHCDILVPSSKACVKGGWWHHAQPDTDKQCYQTYKEHQYRQCLKTLESSSRYWISFSNARQNAVVMCQASRDAIERENHLDTFKNLTQIMGAVSSNIEKTNDEYETLIKEQKQFAEELRTAQVQLTRDVQAVQDKALSTVTSLDNKFHAFMDASIADLVTALAHNQNAEIARIHESMQVFSQDMIAEGSKLSTFFTTELQRHHEQAMTSLEMHHSAQVESYTELSHHMADVTDAVVKTNSTINSSLSKIGSVEQRLDSLSDKAETIAKGFALVSRLPELLTSMIHGVLATGGFFTIIMLIYRFNAKLATCLLGALSTAYLFYTCRIYDLVAYLYTPATSPEHPIPSSVSISHLSTTQKGAFLVFFVWVCAYPITRLNAALSAAFTRLLTSYFFTHHTNEGGTGLLPCIEVPALPAPRKVDSSRTFFPHSDSYPLDESL
jgi:predicted ATPase